jgi:PAS domain S-box-containing protein
MNNEIFTALVYNVSLLLALVLLFDAIPLKSEPNTRLREIVSGLILGFIGIAVMTNPWQLIPGVIFDTRSILISTAGLFFGFVPTATATFLIASLRLFEGGVGVWTGCAVILTSAGLGLLWRHYRAHLKQLPVWLELFLFGVVVHIFMLLWMLSLPGNLGMDVLKKIALPVLLIYPFGTFLLGRLLTYRLERRVAADLLQKSEERYRCLFENHHAIMLLIDPDNGNLADVNPAACEFYGWSRKKMKKMNVSEINILPGGDIKALMQMARTQQRNLFHFRHRLADGSIRDVEACSGPIQLEGRTLLLSVNHDITNETQALTALKESDERFRRALENIPDVVVLYDTDLKIRYINEATRQITGRPTSDFIGKREDEIWPPEIYKAYLPALRKALETRAAQALETEIFLPETGLRKLRITCFPLLDDEKNVREILGITQDLTELEKRAQEYKELINGMNDAAFVIGFDGKLIEVNDAAVELSGYSREELLSMGLADIESDTGGDRIRNLTEGMKSNKRLVLETQHRTKDGLLIPVEISSSLVTYQGGLVILSIARDITDRKHAQEEHERVEAQLRQSQKMEAVGRLAGGVAHDFNNMLNVIVVCTDMALSQLKPQDALYEDLQDVLEAARRSNELTSQLLAFSRKQAVSPQVINLNDVLKERAKMLDRLIGDDVAISFKPAVDLWNIKVDSSQIDQIVTNLAVNARDAISGVGQISIETTNVVLDESYRQNHFEVTPGDYVLLIFGDTGEGMDETTVEQIFEPFFTTKPEGKGSGLGLSTVYGIVKQNNGIVNVYSVPGMGTTFKIYFPRFHGAVQETLKKIVRRSLKGTETVLVVEDEEQVMKVAKRVLQQNGYTVLAASDPNEALRLAEGHKGEIHLLLTDVVMPYMNGKDLQLRMREARPAIKTIFMSGFPADIIARHGILEEGIDFLPKPFSMKSLGEKVRDVLDA